MQTFPGVLVSAGIELTFFLVAVVVLCLGFSMRRMLITHWCFQLLLSSVYTKSRIFQLLVPSQQEGWRGTKSWEGTQPGQLTQTGQRGIPYHVTSCPVCKLGGVGRRGADHYSGTNWASVSKWWAIALCITCFVYAFYYYCNFIIVIIIIIIFFLSVLLNCSYLNPRVLLFSFWLSPPSHWGVAGSEWVAAWCLVAGWG